MEGKRPLGRLRSPYREMAQRGITTENWLNHLNEMSDSEIAAMLEVDSRSPIWKEAKAAMPNLTDRSLAEQLRDFGI